MEVRYYNSKEDYFKALLNVLEDVFGSIKGKEKKEEDKSAPDITVNHMIIKIAELEHMTPYNVNRWLSFLPDYLKFSALLRAGAIIMDEQYPDHINNAKVDKYYTIDMSNGRVCEVPKGKIKNFRNFAAFRTLEDIKAVTKVIRPLMKRMWPNE